jgi:hypothetical protein|tara:strand:+ start:2033 stop:2245 length:213 start_codon:yes stop_codon:yes gene_type:complete
LEKKAIRPKRKFLNSIRKTPAEILENHSESLPTPFPIRIPLAFLLRGMCGKELNQIFLFVKSDFLADFFK